MARILMVEDDPALGAGLKDLLEFHGFEVDRATSGGEAIGRAAVRRYDLILLDLMLPEMSGEDLCRRWRREGLATPIVIVTAKGAVRERVLGLELGADDYIAKPFAAEELLARVKAVLRRTAPGARVTTPFAFAGVEVDLARPAAGGKPLTRLEAALVRYFAANPGRVIGRDELLERVWNEPAEAIETRTVDVHVAKLRAKVEADPSAPRHLRTVRGEGGAGLARSPLGDLFVNGYARHYFQMDEAACGARPRAIGCLRGPSLPPAKKFTMAFSSLLIQRSWYPKAIAPSDMPERISPPQPLRRKRLAPRERREAVPGRREKEAAVRALSRVRPVRAG